MDTRPLLSGILETVLYCDSSNEEVTRDFYVDVMGFDAMVFDFGYRVGSEGHVFLLFNRDMTVDQEHPPPARSDREGSLLLHSCARHL